MSTLDFFQLPSADGLNIGALARLFRHTTNSYKFIFFLALMELLRRSDFDADRPYTYAEITIEMLIIAWYPHSFFKLSFGTQDTLAKKLSALDLEFGDTANLFGNDRRALRSALVRTDLKQAYRLMDFVPYRLLIPFLEPQLENVDKASWMVFETAMPAITNKHFSDARPLYRFDSDDYNQCASLTWHPDWIVYIRAHFAIIQGWASWHWLQYMQRRNPATPALSSKLFPPVKRDSLGKQTRFWRTVLKHPEGTGLRCIYSGAELVNGFALDHYLPWTFVVHDQLWNLVPTVADVNSSKSNRLPSPDYFEDFVIFQHRGLVIAHKAISRKEFDKLTEDYLTDLHLPSSDALLDYQRHAEAYDRHLPPLIALAINQGFSPDWRYPI